MSEEKIANRVYRVIYGASILLAFVILVIGIKNSWVYGPWVLYGGEPAYNFFSLFLYVLFAVVVFGGGWSVRYIFTGNKGIKV